MNVVIAGQPNVGKSSLLNRLAGYDRAIVTEIAGTTRDTVEELVEIRGLPVRLVDTAGIRETEDRIEREGIGRAQSAMEQADMILWVSSPESDGGDPAAEEAKAIRAAAMHAPLAVVAGKQDTEEGRTHAKAVKDLLGGSVPDLLPFSAKTGDGLDAIRNKIQAVYDETGSGSQTEVLLLNARHAAAVHTALAELKQTEVSIGNGLTEDLASARLQAAAEAMAAITGDAVSDRIVETIFSRFCVGK